MTTESMNRFLQRASRRMRCDGRLPSIQQYVEDTPFNELQWVSDYDAPKRAWFELILEDVTEAGEAWTCYEVGLEEGDVDGTAYVRADIADGYREALEHVRRLHTEAPELIPGREGGFGSQLCAVEKIMVDRVAEALAKGDEGDG